jgi:hypothetical protein
MKSVERAHVEMIEVRVGKKHDIDLGEVANGQRAEQKLERLDATFRQSIHARGKRTNGERVSRRDFGFDFSSAKGI